MRIERTIEVAYGLSARLTYEGGEHRTEWLPDGIPTELHTEHSLRVIEAAFAMARVPHFQEVADKTGEAVEYVEYSFDGQPGLVRLEPRQLH